MVQQHHERKFGNLSPRFALSIQGQTSVSFALRVKYEQYLRDLEYLQRNGVPELQWRMLSQLLSSKSTWKLKNKSPIQKSKGTTAAARDKENQQWRELDIHKGIITRAKADKETAAIRPKYAKRFPDPFNEELLASNRDQCLKDEPANQVKVRVIRLESILHKTYEFLDAVESEDPEDFKHHEATLGLTKPKQRT